MNPETIIRELLATFTDARDPLINSGLGGSGGGPTMLSMWHQGSYQQIEDALKMMRSCGGEESGVLLASLWWVLIQCYLMSERKAVWKVGEREVEEMIRRPKCICGQTFCDTQSARSHIEKAHKPTAELSTIYTAEYRQIPLARRKECEALGIRWIADWFRRKGIKPHLPKDFRESRAA